MPQKSRTVDRVAKIFCQAVQDVLQSSTGSRIRYAPTIQKVPSISLKPDLGCFVQFYGDYSGLFIMNFSGPAALELYRRSMTFMGMPEEELVSNYNSDDVVNFVGETVNQIIGAARRIVESDYGLTASNNQPKAISIASAITMSVATILERPVCRRLSFKTQDNQPFYVEMNMEQTEFIRLDEKNSDEGELDVEELLRTQEGSDEGANDIDIDALLDEYS